MDLGDERLVGFGAIVGEVVGPEESAAHKAEFVEGGIGEQKMIAFVDPTYVKQASKPVPFWLIELNPRSDGAAHLPTEPISSA